MCQIGETFAQRSGTTRQKADQKNRLERLLSDGQWDQTRELKKKPKKPKQGRLRNASGDLVDSSEWADAMAHHLEMAVECAVGRT